MSIESPTVRRRRLALALKRLRDQSGLTADQAAREIGISKSSLSRIENAQVSALPPVARSLLELYGVEGPDLDSLIQVAREARRRGWWQKYDDVLPEWFEVYVGLEVEAAQIQTFQPQLVPGILQTEDYARAVITVEHPDAPADEVDRRVELRMRRQRPQDGPRLWVILDEAALRRPIGGPATFTGQLSRLAEDAARPGNTIQVLPFDAGQHASMGSAFTILTFAEPMDPGIVYVESRAGGSYLEGPQVREHTVVFHRLVAAALGPDRSLRLLADAASAPARKHLGGAQPVPSPRLHRDPAGTT